MTRYALALILAIAVTYGLLEAWPLLAGPRIVVDSPVEGATSPDGILTIAGRATRVSLLSLDGSPLLHDETGNFSETLAFPRGGSILTFKATDRFGRTVSITRTIFVP